MTPLDTTEGFAESVNDLGVVVGARERFAGAFQAVQWQIGGGDGTLLGELPGDNISIARDVNSLGQIVGVSNGPNGPRAVLWEPGAAPVELNTLLPAGSGWNLTVAWAINDLGQIVGEGELNGQTRGFLLTRLVTDLVDPMPGMTFGADVTEDVEILAQDGLGRAVLGVGADGVARIVIRVKGIPNPGNVLFELTDEVGGTNGVGKLRTPGNAEDLASLNVPTVQLGDGRHMAFAVYVAPDDFVRDAGDLIPGVRTVNLDVTYTPSGSGDILTSALPILVRRPPVLLLHGIWSTQFTWALPIQADGRFTVHAHGYAGANGNAFFDNVVQPRSGVAYALHKFRALGFAAIQADVVGHSMGGILTRLYVSDDYNPEQPYLRIDNFLEGDVNRLITVDTPHIGSPLANGLQAITDTVSGTPLQDPWSDAWNAFAKCVDCGAVFDLQTDSAVVVAMPVANVPAHAIVGKGGSDFIQLGLEESYLPPIHRQILRFLRAFGLAPEDIFPPSLQHDMIVGRVSQEGRLTPGSGELSIFGIDDPDPGTKGLHWTVTDDDPAVADRIEELLNTPVGDTATFAPSFPAAPGGSPASSGFNLPPYGDLISGLVITSPAPGAMVVPGQTMEVTVEPIDGFVPAHVLVYTRFDHVFDDMAPFTVNIDIPLDAIGDVTIGALAFDADWDMAQAAEILVEVQITATLQDITFAQDPVFLFSYAPQYQLNVLGTYDDGVVREITSPDFGTIYSSADPAIVTVDSEGIVTAVALGATAIQATNGSNRDIVNVFVESFSCLGDLDDDAVVGTSDLLALLAAWGPCPNPPEPCPADLDEDGQVGTSDLLLLLANWGPCE